MSYAQIDVVPTWHDQVEFTLNLCTWKMRNEFIISETHKHTHVAGRGASLDKYVYVIECNITVKDKSTGHNLPGPFAV